MALESDDTLLTRIGQMGQMSREDAAERVNDVFRDGVVSREEAERLFDLASTLGEQSPGWDARFIEAIGDYLLLREAPEGWISDDEADWLIARIEASGAKTAERHVELLLALMRKADGAPPRLALYALSACCERIEADGRAEAEEVERVRRTIYGPASEGGLWVTRAEATLLFRTNDKVAHARNDPSWNDLFARAIGNHLLAAAHPDPISQGEALRRENWLKSADGGVFSGFAQMLSDGSWFQRLTHDPDKARAAHAAAREAARRAGAEVTDEEEGWLMRRLGWDKSVSPAERALIAFLKAEAPGFVDGLTVAA